LARVPEKSQALFFTIFRQHSPGPDRTGFFLKFIEPELATLILSF
jgi:hypothetical protein